MILVLCGSIADSDNGQEGKTSVIRKKEKCPGLREQSQGHKDKITAISLAKTGGKVNGKV